MACPTGVDRTAASTVLIFSASTLLAISPSMTAMLNSSRRASIVAKIVEVLPDPELMVNHVRGARQTVRATRARWRRSYPENRLLHINLREVPSSSSGESTDESMRLPFTQKLGCEPIAFRAEHMESIVLGAGAAFERRLFSLIVSMVGSAPFAAGRPR